MALFVGIFLILNTFSIIVAQRTRELALMRAIGASRRQVIGSVLLEAVVIGLIASVLGLAAGIGVGALLAYLFGSVRRRHWSWPGSACRRPRSSRAFAVGLVVTVIAALLPALRASRVAAGRGDAGGGHAGPAADPDHAIGGAVVLARRRRRCSALGLAGNAGDADLWTILGGVLRRFIGVALLTPLISRPVVVACSAGCSPGRCRASSAGATPAATRAAPRSPPPR